MDWSDVGLEGQRDAAIIRAQLQDALSDVWQWQSMARSNQESLYLEEMEQCLIFLRGVVAARLSGAEPNGEKQDWDANMRQLVDSYERAKQVRGQGLGYHLKSLVCAFFERMNDIRKEPEDRDASRVGKNITQFRKECGWTYDELADATLIDRKQIILHAKGRAKPRPRTLRKYSEAFTKALGRPISPGDLEK